MGVPAEIGEAHTLLARRLVNPPPTPSSAPSQSGESSPTGRFAALIEGYGRLVAQAVRQVAGREAANDLPDIQQEVMLALWRRLGGEQDIEHPASYLYTAAIREAVRAVQRVRRRAESPLDATPAEPQVDAAAEGAVVQGERRAILERALATLAPDRARAVRAHLAGLSVDETMHLYGWTYQRTRNLLARGVSDLKVLLRSAS